MAPAHLPTLHLDQLKEAFPIPEEGDLVRVTSRSETFEGEFLPRAGMAFVHVRGPGGGVKGPCDRNCSIVLLEGKAVRAARFLERRMGEPVPGRLVRDRDGYQARLERLANAAARSAGARRREIIAQFDAVADEIALAVRKRAWMRAVASWNTHSNEPPTKAGMSGYDATVAEKLERPRPQDFHPDQAERRRRERPVEGRSSSAKSVVAALRKAGYAARLSVFCEDWEDSVEVVVEAPDGRARGRFSLVGKALPSGERAWTVGWLGNDTKADRARQARCEREGGFDRVRDALASVLAEAAAPTRAAALASPTP